MHIEKRDNYIDSCSLALKPQRPHCKKDYSLLISACKLFVKKTCSGDRLELLQRFPFIPIEIILPACP